MSALLCILDFLPDELADIISIVGSLNTEICIQFKPSRDIVIASARNQNFQIGTLIYQAIYCLHEIFSIFYISFIEGIQN